MTEGTDHARRAVDAVWRIESPRLIAGLTAIVQDIDLAEEIAQDALLAAMEQWPSNGVPDNPGAWLMRIGKRRAVDTIRRRVVFTRKLRLLGHELTIQQNNPSEELPARVDPDKAIDDDLLRMIFTSCHPALSRAGRIALTLKFVGGLTTTEIARAFLVSESTVGQRILRAKRTITAQRIPFEIPHAADLEDRLTSVLEVIYLIFNEGYTATKGDDWLRLDLCEDSLRLSRMLSYLMPFHPEVLGLAALLELQSSRLGARIDPTNMAVLLPDQQRSRWDKLLIRRGYAALIGSEQLRKAQNIPPGRYALQAAIAACHALAKNPEETNWTRIVELYGILAEGYPSPIVELNRAVAVGMLHGPAVALKMVDELVEVDALDSYHLLHSIRGDLLAKLGRGKEAKIEFERAVSKTSNEAERATLLARARS
ncbi:RNA polymerase sigma factor [Nocardia sp. NPDC003963]